MLQIDVAKAGGQLFNLSSTLNARVYDGFTPLFVQWINSTNGKNIIQTQGKRAFLEGRIGQGKINDKGVELEATSNPITWEDDGAGSRPNGITEIELPPQVFTRDGIFYGNLGLKDATGTVMTSVDVWFNVAKNNLVAGVNAPYYFSALNDALGRVEQAADSLQIFKRKVDDQVELARITYQPETFETLDDLKKKYPNGAPGIYVVDADGHKYIWSHGAWKDCGIYQAAGIADDSIPDSKIQEISTDKIQVNDVLFGKEKIFGDNPIKKIGNSFQITNTVSVNPLLTTSLILKEKKVLFFPLTLIGI